MGQRYVQLKSTYTGYVENNTAVLHVSQVPPNPAILAPGPAFVFVVVNGVPSVGAQVMIGSGQLGTQPVLAVADLPESRIVPNGTSSPGGSGSKNAASHGCVPWRWGNVMWGVLLGAVVTRW
jgi:hypothetical protein